MMFQIIRQWFNFSLHLNKSYSGIAGYIFLANNVIGYNNKINNSVPE
jgi:hypothetical protein